MWLLLGVPHVTLHAIRQGLPLFINFIAEDLGCSTADKAFLLGAFYPGYCVAMLPSGMVVKGVGAKRLLGLGLGGTAALLALLPLSAGSGGALPGSGRSGSALARYWMRFRTHPPTLFFSSLAGGRTTSQLGLDRAVPAFPARCSPTVRGEAAGPRLQGHDASTQLGRDQWTPP